jgi:hypothetical protein
MIPFSPNAIRLATDADAGALARLAQLDSARPLTAPILVAEEEGAAIAATSLHDGRVIADPFTFTQVAEAALRVRARALGAALATPSLADRMRAAFASARLVAAPSAG